MRPTNSRFWDRSAHRVLFLSSFVLLALLYTVVGLDRDTRGELVRAHVRPAPLDPWR